MSSKEISALKAVVMLVVGFVSGLFMMILSVPLAIIQDKDVTTSIVISLFLGILTGIILSLKYVAQMNNYDKKLREIEKYKTNQKIALENEIKRKMVLIQQKNNLIKSKDLPNKTREQLIHNDMIIAADKFILTKDFTTMKKKKEILEKLNRIEKKIDLIATNKN